MSVPIISLARCFMLVVNIAYVCWCDANMTAEKNSPPLKKHSWSCDGCASVEKRYKCNKVLTCANDKLLCALVTKNMHLCCIHVVYVISKPFSNPQNF